MPSIRQLPIAVALGLVLVGLSRSSRPAQAQARLVLPPGGENRSGLGGPLDNHIDWMAFHDSGWKAMNKGWYDTAEREFLAAIRVARRPSMNDPRLLARSYSSLAWSLQKAKKALAGRTDRAMGAPDPPGEIWLQRRAGRP